MYTGIPLWRQALSGAVIGSPVAQVESVVALTDDESVISYSSGGTRLWAYFAGGRLTPYVSRSREGTTYIGRIDGILIAVSRAGRKLWQVDLTDPIVFPVLIGWDGRLFAFTDRRITAMTAAGFVLWSRAFERRTVLSPVRDNAGGIILVKEDGELIRVDPFGNIFSFMTVAGYLPVAVASIEIEGRGLAILLLYENRNMELVFYGGGQGSPGNSSGHSAFAENLRVELLLPSPPLCPLLAMTAFSTQGVPDGFFRLTAWNTISG